MMGNRASIFQKSKLEMSLFPALWRCCTTNTTNFATIVKKKIQSSRQGDWGWLWNWAPSWALFWWRWERNGGVMMEMVVTMVIVRVIVVVIVRVMVVVVAMVMVIPRWAAWWCCGGSYSATPPRWSWSFTTQVCWTQCLMWDFFSCFLQQFSSKFLAIMGNFVFCGTCENWKVDIW